MFKGSGLKVLKVELCGFIKIIFLEIFLELVSVFGEVLRKLPRLLEYDLNTPVKLMLNILIQDIMNFAMQDKFKT